MVLFWGNGALSGAKAVLAKPAEHTARRPRGPRSPNELNMAVRGLPYPIDPNFNPAVESGKKFICGREKAGGIGGMIMFSSAL